MWLYIYAGCDCCCRELIDRLYKIAARLVVRVSRSMWSIASVRYGRRCVLRVDLRASLSLRAMYRAPYRGGPTRPTYIGFTLSHGSVPWRPEDQVSTAGVWNNCHLTPCVHICSGVRTKCHSRGHCTFASSCWVHIKQIFRAARRSLTTYIYVSSR